jgi:DUF971 family protein
LTAPDIWPEELRIQEQGRNLHVKFQSGEAYDLPAELLRVESPSAEVKGHGPGQEQLVFGKRNVVIKKVEPVGSYAIRLIFSDGHDTGLFTWPYLAKLGQSKTELWQAYEEKLVSAGRKRD